MAKKNKQIKLGQKVKCMVTGFVGIATARCEYLNGCVQYCVIPRTNAKENKMPEGLYIDVGRLKVVGEGVKVQPSKEVPGGPMPNTPSSNYSG